MQEVQTQLLAYQILHNSDLLIDWTRFNVPPNT